MVTSNSPQGLAALGRNGDSMLVHMSPHEVAGLQSLAMAQGGSLTINPETGLPEAFSLGGVFSSLLPMAAGMFMGPAAGAIFGQGSGIASFLSTPLGAGLTTGALTAAMTGDIGKGAMAGLGAAGGAGLGQGLSNFGATGSVAPATTAELNQGVAQAATQKALSGAAPNVGGWFPGKEAFAAGPGPQMQSMGQGLGGMQAVAPAVQASTPLATPSFESLGKGFSAVTEAPGKFIESYGPGKLAMQAAGPIMGGLEPSDLGYTDEPLYEDPDKNKYRGPQGQLNLSGSTGLKLVAQGGAIKSYAIGGNVGNPSVGGGLSDLYNRPEGQALENISNDGYGIGRLNTLAAQESLQNAKVLGYEDGGSVTSGDSSSTSSDAPGSDLPSDAYMSDIQRSLMGRSPVHYTGASSSPGFSSSSPYGSDMIGEMLRVSPEVFRYDYGMGRGTMLPGGFMPRREYGMAEGGLASIAKGGYLDGEGDGMSDSIPATIEGKQPARLADGEFVIPADVVSHLGNGSSKAGSKRLYAMLDKVRQARTGNKKQGKEIKPEKYMPA